MKIRALLLATVAATLMQSSFSQPVPARQARDKGISACLKQIDKVASFLVKDDDHNSNATWSTSNPDSRLFNSQITIKYSDGPGLAVMNVAPTRSGKCDASYSRIFPLDKSCISIRETTYKEWKFNSDNFGAISISNVAGTVDGVLLPAGSGCVVVLTETLLE